MTTPTAHPTEIEQRITKFYLDVTIALEAHGHVVEREGFWIYRVDAAPVSVLVRDDAVGIMGLFVTVNFASIIFEQVRRCDPRTLDAKSVAAKISAKIGARAS